jgi:hypothetical protein
MHALATKDWVCQETLQAPTKTETVDVEQNALISLVKIIVGIKNKSTLCLNVVKVGYVHQQTDSDSQDGVYVKQKSPSLCQSCEVVVLPIVCTFVNNL